MGKFGIILTFTIIFNLFSSDVSSIVLEDPSFRVTRLGGENRVLTSVNVSQSIFKESKTVILVGYKGEIDALGGTLLAGKLDAPIIITEKEKLSAKVKEEIERLGARDIIILGGKRSVSENVEKDLKVNNYNVERIDGFDREETAVKTAKKAVGETIEEVFLSLGYGVYADALSIGPVTSSLNKPLLLAGRGALSPTTIKALKDMQVKRVTIVGGQAVVSKSIEDTIRSMNIAVDRIYGKNREETSVKIAERYIKKPASIVVANGYVFPDSVIGGYYAYKKDAPIILTRGDKLSDDSFKYVNRTRQNTVILGLYSAVGKKVEWDLNIILKTDKFRKQFFLLPKSEGYDKLEASMMMDRVMNINPKTISNIYSGGVRMKFSKGPITDEPEYASLKGKVPRGWEGLGKTWDDVPGAGGTETPIARIGYSDPGDHTGHNSINLELHELAHSIDNFISGTYSGEQISSSTRFKKIWKEEVRIILPDSYYIDYSEEYFAEVFAMYYLNPASNTKLLKKAPKTYAFIKSLDSLNLDKILSFAEKVEVLKLGSTNFLGKIGLENIIMQEERYGL
nr:cell wall-binding repeat-containing protein [Tissierella sp.]